MRVNFLLDIVDQMIKVIGGFFVVCSIMCFGLADPGQMVEICDNGLDDDMDGLVDLLDPDCECPLTTPSSLIPNPSFEQLECCPEQHTQLSCAEGWRQASEPTTDFYHTCGLLEIITRNELIKAPLPFPDGEGAIGFYNGNIANPNFKEYTGTCLPQPLKKGVSYALQFHLGFESARRSPPLNITVFGSANCGNLPFGLLDNEYGCPLNGKGWMLLDSVTVRGENNWVQESFFFTPEEDIAAVVIGPECRDDPFGSFSHYYFLDNLILAEVHEFEMTITSNNEPCSSDYQLFVKASDSVSYQWYRDGVAILNATEAVLHGPLTSGVYQVRLQGGSSCKVSPEFTFSRPESRNAIEVLVCDEDTYDFNGAVVPVPGFYTDTLLTKEGCDSILDISLTRNQGVANYVEAKIFPGETFKLGSHSLNTPLQDSIYFMTSSGCDSLVILNLSYFNVYIPNAFSPDGDGVNDVFTIYGDEDLLEIQSLHIFDRWGNTIIHKAGLDPLVSNATWDGSASSGEALKSGVFVFTMQVLMSDRISHKLSGSVVLLR